MSLREKVAAAIASGLDGWTDFDAASEDYRNELLSAADAALSVLDVENEYLELEVTFSFGINRIVRVARVYSDVRKAVDSMREKARRDTMGEVTVASVRVRRVTEGSWREISNFKS